jgi:cytochrome P450
VFGEDADIFRPERWIVDPANEAEMGKLREMERTILTVRLNAKKNISYDHLGMFVADQIKFGTGARTCIGKNISLMEIGKFVPQILRHFDVEFDTNNKNEIPEWKVQTYWFAKQSGMRMRFLPRK